MDVAVPQLAPVGEQPALDASMPENVSDSAQSASVSDLGLQETVSNPEVLGPDSLLADWCIRLEDCRSIPDLKTQDSREGSDALFRVYQENPVATDTPAATPAAWKERLRPRKSAASTRGHVS